MKLDRSRAAVAFAALGALTGAAGLAGTAAESWWFLDLFSHFRVQYALVLAACAIGLALLGRYWVAAGCLALALANGQTLQEAAVTLGISLNTARAHLRAIFAETGIDRQTKLVHAILRSVAALG